MIDSIADVVLIGQDLPDCCLVPRIRHGEVGMCHHRACFLESVYAGRYDFFILQDCTDFSGASAGSVKLEYLFYDRCSFRVWNDFLWIVRIFHISIRRVGGEPFPAFCLCFLCGTDFFADVPRIKIIEIVPQTNEFVKAFIAVHTIVYGNVTDVVLRKNQFYVGACFQIIPAQS